MPRYLVERAFPDGLGLPISAQGARASQTIGRINHEEGVSWVHSYVSIDRRTTFCIYDAPTPEAIRRAAACNKLPVTQITEVRVLDPYFFFV